MRVKLSDHVPGFIRDLSEPAHANKYGGYVRPPPLIGTIVRVVGDPLEQKRAHRQRILESSIIGIFLRSNSQQNTVLTVSESLQLQIQEMRAVYAEP